MPGLTSIEPSAEGVNPKLNHYAAICYAQAVTPALLTARASNRLEAGGWKVPPGGAIGCVRHV
jgi:hypothetical protein